MESNKKQLLKLKSLVLCLVLGANMMLAACADAGNSNTASNQSGFAKAMAIPKKAGGVLYGVTLGVPIRSGKYIVSESQRMTATLLDDFGGPGFWNMAMARAIGWPYGIASGSILGLIRGVQYGAMDGAEVPFSKKSIGLE